MTIGCKNSEKHRQKNDADGHTEQQGMTGMGLTLKLADPYKFEFKYTGFLAVPSCKPATSQKISRIDAVGRLTKTRQRLASPVKN